MKEFEILFVEVLPTRFESWSFGGVIASGPEKSLTHSASMHSETLINVKEDKNLLRNTNEEVHGSKKKHKKGKKIANSRRNE